MNCERARETLAEIVIEDGQIPAEVTAHVKSCPTCAREAEGLRDVWSLMREMEPERSSQRMRARFYEMLEERASEREPLPYRVSSLFRWWPRQPALQAGIALASLVLGIWLGSSGVVDRSERQAIEDLQTRMDTMARAVTLSLLNHQSPSERLRAVSLTESSPPDAEIVHALLRVLNEDPSVNVRLAALDALARLPESAEVREGLYQAFPRQSSLPMQAAMIDVMLAMNGPRSHEEIQKAAKNEQLPPAIRDYASEVASERRKGI